MMNKKIAVIGAGNMGSALIKGIIKHHAIEASNISVYDLSNENLERLKPHGVHIANSEEEVIQGTDYIFLIVKPFHIAGVLEKVKTKLTKQQIIISIAASIGSQNIINIIGKNNPIVLAMPNTGIAVGESMTCIATPNASEAIMQELQSLLNHVGSCFIVEEKQMGAATAIGGCGTAFGLRFIRAAMLAGTEMGIKPKEAKLMGAQIAMGAAKIILENDTHPEDEIDKVTTPGGITINGLNEMEHNCFSSSIIKGLMSAFGKVTK